MIMKGRLVALKGDKNNGCVGGPWETSGYPWGPAERDRRVYLVSNCWDQTKKYGTIINYVRVDWRLKLFRRQHQAWCVIWYVCTEKHREREREKE